jgi:hypothetical protein
MMRLLFVLPVVTAGLGFAGPGGHWFQPGKVAHDNHCEEKGGTCLSFVYLPNGWDSIPAKTAAADAKPAAKK